MCGKSMTSRVASYQTGMRRYFLWGIDCFSQMYKVALASPLNFMWGIDFFSRTNKASLTAPLTLCEG